MNTDFYETQDLYTATALRAAGFDLHHVSRDERNAKRATFFFSPTLVAEDGECDIEDAVKDYWDYKLTLPARSYVDAFQELKTRVYEVIG